MIEFFNNDLKAIM